jgi:hypothetical protein
MPFKPGDPRPPGSGRRKGVKNKKPTLRSFRAALAEEGFDAVDELIDLYRSTKDEHLQFAILKLMLEYSQVKPTTDLDEHEADELNSISEAKLLQLAMRPETGGETENHTTSQE